MQDLAFWCLVLAIIADVVLLITGNKTISQWWHKTMPTWLNGVLCGVTAFLMFHFFGSGIALVYLLGMAAGHVFRF